MSSASLALRGRRFEWFPGARDATQVRFPNSAIVSYSE